MSLPKGRFHSSQEKQVSHLLNNVLCFRKCAKTPNLQEENNTTCLPPCLLHSLQALSQEP